MVVVPSMEKGGSVPVVIQLLVGLGILTLNLGCGGRRSEPLPPLYSVKGAVRCDGAPLVKGEIVFEGVDDAELAIPPAAASIIDGAYEAKASCGKKTVRIYAPAEFGAPDVTGLRATRETIAPAFNAKSTTVVEVAPGDGNEFDFDVRSR